MKIKWNTQQVNQFLHSHFPRLFQYLSTATAPPANQQASSSLLTILPYAVVTRQGKQLAVVNTFHPTGKTLREALHNGGEFLRRAINLRTIYLGTVQSLAHNYHYGSIYFSDQAPHSSKCPPHYVLCKPPCLPNSPEPWSSTRR